MADLERIAQKIHKRHEKSNARRRELREAFAAVNHAEVEKDDADLFIYSEATKQQILEMVRELDNPSKPESKDYNNPRDMAESGEE